MATKLAQKRVSPSHPGRLSRLVSESIFVFVPSSSMSSPDQQLQKEFQAMEKSPPPFIYARFEEKNILDCELVVSISVPIFD